MLEKYRTKLELILTILAVEGFLLYGMLSTVCEETWENTGRWWNLILLGVYACVAVKIVLQKNSWIDWMTIIGLVGLVELSRITTQTNAVLWFAAGILLVKNMDLNRILRADGITRCLLGSFLIVFPLLGLYPNHADFFIGGRLRSSFGWAHPNEMGLFFLMCCILWLYFRYDKWSLRDSLIGVLLVLGIDHFANSRTSEICVVLLMILAGITSYAGCKTWDLKIRCRIWMILSMGCLVGGCVVSLWLVTILDQSALWYNYLPDTVASRLWLANRFWAEKGFTLFGQVFDNTIYNYLDMMYAYLGLNFGLLILALFLILNMILILGAYKEKNEKLLLITFSLITYSLLEHEHFKMLSGCYPVLLGYYLWPWLDRCRIWIEQYWNGRIRSRCNK